MICPLVTRWGHWGLFHRSGYSFPSSDLEKDSTGVTARGHASPSSRGDSLPLEVAVLTVVATTGGPVGLDDRWERPGRNLSVAHRVLCACVSRSHRRGSNLRHSSAQWPGWLHCEHGKLNAFPPRPPWGGVFMATLCSPGSAGVVRGRLGYRGVACALARRRRRVSSARVAASSARSFLCAAWIQRYSSPRVWAMRDSSARVIPGVFCSRGVARTTG